MQNQSLPENYSYTHLISLSWSHTGAVSLTPSHFYHCVGNFSPGNVSPKLEDKRAKLMPCGIGFVIFKDVQRFFQEVVKIEWTASGEEGKLEGGRGAWQTGEYVKC